MHTTHHKETSTHHPIKQHAPTHKQTKQKQENDRNKQNKTTPDHPDHHTTNPRSQEPRVTAQRRASRSRLDARVHYPDLKQQPHTTPPTPQEIPPQACTGMAGPHTPHHQRAGMPGTEASARPPHTTPHTGRIRTGRTRVRQGTGTRAGG
jgi:hypothetical protein